jgi:hypothetical protein
LEAFGIKKCNAFGELCKGFVANQGMKTVTLKQTFYGKNSFAAGMTIFVKKSYVSLINITGIFEACADTLVCQFFYFVHRKKLCELHHITPSYSMQVYDGAHWSKYNTFYENSLHTLIIIHLLFSPFFFQRSEDNKIVHSNRRRCNVANLDPFDKSIMGVMFKPKQFTCSGQKDLTLYEKGILRINPELKG